MEMAEKRKNKLQTEGCSVVDHLLRKGTLMDEKKKERAAERQASQQVDEELTFKPVTLEYAGRPQLTHGDKCLDLYSRVKPGQYARRNIEERDAEFEDNKLECNFMP